MNIKSEKKDLKIIAYIRVSTLSQDNEKQELEILRYCQQQNISIQDWVKITASSRLTSIERRIDDTLELLNDADVLIVTELSRLSRTMGELLFLLEKLAERNILVVATKDNKSIEETKRDWKDLKFRRFIYAYFAETERELISQRTKEALQSKKDLGFSLGKPKGTLQNSIYDDKLTEIKLLLAKQIPITTISKLINVGKPQSLRIYLLKRKLIIND